MLAAKEALPSARDMADQLNLGNDHGFVFKRGRPITSRTSKTLDSLSKKDNSGDKTQQKRSNDIPSKYNLGTTAETVSEAVADNLAKTPVRKRPAPSGSPMVGGSGLRLDFPEPKRRLTASPLAVKVSGDETILQRSTSDTSDNNSNDVVKEISVPVRKLPQPTPLISRTRTRVFETPVARTPIGSKVGIRRRSGAGVRRTTVTTLNDNAMGSRQQQRRGGRKSTMGKRRRSTFSMRGKRASSIGGGFKALPHDSVDAADFYRHISPELPEPIRLRQLLAWCARRTSAPPTWPDELPEAVKLLLSEALREAVDDIHSAFERGEIATSWYHRPIEDEQTCEQSELLPHPENKANLEAKERLSMRISKLRSENDGWVQELKRASTSHAKALDRLPKSLQTLPMHQEKDSSNATQAISVEPISRALGSIDWSALDDVGVEYIDEANDEVIDVELDNAESQIDQAVQEIEIQLDAFHLDIHRSNEITKEARTKCEYQQRDLGFILEQRRARAMVVAKSLGSIPIENKLNTQSIKTEQTDSTRDLLRTLAAALSGQ
ncbi:hypothetical protein COEREDRAFT_83681 [Coemansia reversa NRRL 1564]|uniref:Kinetochore protein mis13 n=1 Tax=Coemansia reversa (strain ATCC 12441 / NRRL 1564) TaxID=763665 RepID=A0A2G5B2B4_COERN|nr:hypothetical protein COEREDRAFT_83681 [Coemansia reversa NRRL 1564]|eukprot:PIA13163.1 hypothetical protein COEREDRAFT_83681 [Coemansia reversa NRRL 1564]